VNFLPRISEDGDIILTVTPEVSQPDLRARGRRVPSFRVWRASTTAKLREGESPSWAAWSRTAASRRSAASPT
jgi:Flp pilus assembly secretin CpaC